MLVGVVDETSRSGGGAEAAMRYNCNTTMHQSHQYIPAMEVVVVVVAGGLSPAVFLAMMMMVYSLFS